MAANEEGGISGMGDIEQLPPEGILINFPLPMSSTNEGSTNTTDLAVANYTLLEMVSLALLSDFRDCWLVWECLATANQML